jgi:multidrug efflux pump subunit AcrA (membrane-fusion protein)
VSVPLAALVPDGDGIKVFVVDSAHRAYARPVTVGARADQRAEITSGLSGGETVVTVGAYGVDDSARVVPADGGGGRR